MHEFGSANGFGLGEHTAFGAIAEGATADEATPGGVGTREDTENIPRRGRTHAATILKCLPWVGVAIGLLFVLIMVLAQMMEYVGDMGPDVVSSLR